MSQMSFFINDASTGSATPVVKVTITENPDGTLTFKIEQVSVEGVAGYLGDLRGLFFDLADENIRTSLVVESTTKYFADGTWQTSTNNTVPTTGDDSVKSAGSSSNNMNGLLGDGGGYDVGIEIGTEGVGTLGDDIRAFEFTLDSTLRDLTLADFVASDLASASRRSAWTPTVIPRSTLLGRAPLR